VIDESSLSASFLASQWSSFRSAYPDRPFCLLQPAAGCCGSNLNIPADFSSDSKTIYAAVNRDDGVEADRSDWFSACSLGTLRAQGITNVAIFIDNSGSMTTASVQASYNFLLQEMSSNGLQLVSGITNSAEDWIGPFITNFS